MRHARWVPSALPGAAASGAGDLQALIELVLAAGGYAVPEEEAGGGGDDDGRAPA